MAVVLETSAGEMTIDLFVDECPNACLNFLKLCKYKYYNGHLFFNVQQNFLAQVGDPTGTGTGGSSIFGIAKGPAHTYFQGEIKKDRKMNKVGLVGFASASASGDGSNNLCRSQFFITLRGEDFDEGRYTIFGEVAEGLDTLQKINNLYCDEKNRPYQDVRIKHTFILDDPFDDPEQITFPPDSPAYEYPPTESLKRRIPYEDNLGNVDKKAEAELEASIRIKEAQSRALILEMTGDIPDADIKPPREVLFICQLNSVTRDADLQILFSTFGNIKSCQIIRDPKSGDSLNYAFIEYDNEASCVKAYEKMNNVLIDDRRIKVDFSQSVSHLWNRFTQQTRKTGGGGVSRTTHKSAGNSGVGSSNSRGSLAATAGSSSKIADSDYRHSSGYNSGGVGFTSSNSSSNYSITNNNSNTSNNHNRIHNSNSNGQKSGPHNYNNSNSSNNSNNSNSNSHEKDRERYSEKDKNRGNRGVTDSRDRDRDRSRSESRDRRRRRDSRSPERRRGERNDDYRDDNRRSDSRGGDSRERRDRRDRSRSESRNRRRRRESRSPERRRDERSDDKRDDNRRRDRR